MIACSTTIKSSIREYENGIDELELEPTASGWTPEPDLGIPEAQDGDQGADGQPRYVNGSSVLRQSPQERDSGTVRMNHSSLSNGVADAAGHPGALESHSVHVNGHRKNGGSASVSSRSEQQGQYQVGQDGVSVHGYSAASPEIEAQQEQEGEPIIPETSPSDPEQAQEPRVKIEDPPSSPPPARYKVYPAQYDSQDSGDEDEDELDELDDSAGASSSSTDDDACVPVASSTARKTQRPTVSSAIAGKRRLQAKSNSSEDDAGSEKTESETSENERVASQLIIGSGANTPQRRVASPRLSVSAGAPTSATTSGHPASTPAHRSAPPCPSPTSQSSLFDGKFLASYPALLSTVAEALNIPTSRIWGKDSFQTDGEGRTEKVWTLVCPSKECGAGVRTVRTDSGEQDGDGDGEMWKIIGHSTRHARSCPFAEAGAGTEQENGHAALRAQHGVSGSAHAPAATAVAAGGASSSSSTAHAEGSVPPANLGKAYNALPYRQGFFTSFFHVQILMPTQINNKKLRDFTMPGQIDWTPGVCCKACVQLLLEREGSDGVLYAPLKRIQRGSATHTDIELLCKIPECEFLTIFLVPTGGRRAESCTY